MDLTRRQVVTAALAGGVLTACSSRDAPAVGSTTVTGAGASSSTPAPVTTSGARPTPPGAALPATHAWVARRGEVEPAVKARATRLVEAVGAWTGGRGDLASARARAAAAGFAPGLADELAPLLGPEPGAVVAVRDAQYGGILTSSASVLVVVDQWRAHPDGTVTAGGTTLDVRLVAASPHWRVVRVLPATPGRAVARLTRAARAVLTQSRIRLPHAATADVRAGAIHDSVLTLLSGLAREHVVDVSVLRSGHPVHVFGTSRPSDHGRGRAVDVWALDGSALVLPAHHELAASAMRFAVVHGAYNVGGPVRLAGPRYFTNRTHQDHVHLGLDH